MTRYTRAKGSKACNDRKEEEATPWHVLRQPLFNQSVDNLVQENTNCSNSLKSLHSNNYASTNEVWSEFVEELKRKSSDSSLETNNHKKKDNVFEKQLNMSNLGKNKVKQRNPDDTQSELKHKILGKKPVNLKNKGGEIIVKNISNEGNKTDNCEKIDILKKTKKSTKKLNSLERKTCNNPGNNNCDKQTYNSYCHSKAVQSTQDSRPVQQQVFSHKKSLLSKNHHDKQTLPLNHDNSKNKVNKNSKWNNYEDLYTIIANGRKINVVKFEGFWIKQDDALELKKLRKGLRSKNIPNNEIKMIMKLERRKAEKSLAREKNNVCFQCRKFGHNFSDCPDIKDTQLSKSGMCFKCGSMEHSFFECKVLQNQDFRFAVCFVCQDQGHIAKQCPLNSRGQYPKGGSCHLCGEVTHLRKDCPKAISEKTKAYTVEQLKNDLEDLSEVTTQSKKADVLKIKVVKF